MAAAGLLRSAGAGGTGVTADGFGQAFRRYEAPGTTPNIDAMACRALLRGMTPQDAVKVYGVNLRTAYRWRRELVAVEVVRVDGWTATFARRRSQPPVRLTAWERVA